MLLTYKRTVFEQADAKSYQVRRILNEMHICVENSFIVYSHEKSISEWCVLLPHGRIVYWDLLIQFRCDSPYSPPVFRFLSIPSLVLFYFCFSDLFSLFLGVVVIFMTDHTPATPFSQSSPAGSIQLQVIG
jgi:hypothetical protein